MNQFGEDYFLRGPASGLSNYVAYSWRPELTIPACRKIMHYLGARTYDSLLEIGCARGFYTKAMRLLCYRAYGFDISEWAIANCDPDVTEFVSNEYPKRSFDWAFAKDTFEHLTLSDLAATMGTLNNQITKGMLFIVPLAEEIGGRYVRTEDEKDVTHVIRWTLDYWIKFMEDNAPDFNVNGSYCISGIKPAASLVPHSTGFLTLSRP